MADFETNESELMFQEKMNTGTAKTNNEEMEENGYVVVKNLWDPEELYHPVPEERGQLRYSGDNFELLDERQVPDSVSRYTHPQYKKIHSGVRLKLEKILGRKLYNTYYYDRFYFPGQQLKKHIDRAACEISVTIHISTNLEEGWPIWIKTPDTYTDKERSDILVRGEERSLVLKPGDGLIYKGCERPHWRDAMPGSNEDLYYHQIFMHYVLADGQRSHHAYDNSRWSPL